VDDKSDAKQAQKRRDLQFIGLVGAELLASQPDNHSQAQLGLIIRINHSEKNAKDRKTNLRKNRQKLILLCTAVKIWLRKL
jgi:hypothetical protein